MRENFFWVTGESGRGFGLEVMRKSKLIVKKTKKREILNMMVSNFSYSNSYHFFNIIVIIIIIMIILIFLLPTANVFGLFLWRAATYY